MSDIKPALAILDWGIGGMDFYRIFKARYPQIGICYISDSGDVPYGKQQKAQLISRLYRIVAFLRRQGVTNLVVACNAMSTVLPEVSEKEALQDFRITGVIEPAISTALALKAERVGVVGGRRTILSGAYSRPLRQSFPAVTQRIAQPLSALIERGETESPLFHDTLKKIMAPLKKADILLLACTHYPAAQEAFQTLAPNARLLNPSAEAFQWVSSHWRLGESPASDVFYTTGDPAEMQSASYTAFGVKVGDITRIVL